jgi:hypothetical protein
MDALIDALQGTPACTPARSGADGQPTDADAEADAEAVEAEGEAEAGDGEEINDLVDDPEPDQPEPPVAKREEPVEPEPTVEPQPPVEPVVDSGDVPPPRPGAYQVRKPPGVRVGPSPRVEIIVTVTPDQLAAALAAAFTAGPDRDRAGEHDPPGPSPNQADGLWRVEGDPRAAHGVPVLGAHAAAAGLCRPTPPRPARPARGGTDPGPVHPLRHPRPNPRPVRPRRRLHHPRLPRPRPRLPRAPPPGVGRRRRHPPEQPDPAVPRHHTEIHDDTTWQIHIIDGVPWVRPPAWATRTDP